MSVPRIVPAPSPAPDDGAFSGEHYRRVMSAVPTSVAVVAGLGPDGRPVGLAVGTFISVSLDPPLICFCPGAGSSSWPEIRPGGRFCVNVLGSGQEDVCAVFAGKGRDKFAGIPWTPGANGAPRLDGAVAWVECDLQDEYEAGDHTIAVGRVTRIDPGSGVPPLVFLGGRCLPVG